MNIDIRKVSKHFGSFIALRDVSLDIQSGELLALLGPSGSGKTTLLRIIAGLDCPDEGEIYFAGADAVRLNLKKRHVGFVFQHYALFRHMSVFENIAFGLRVRPRKERKPDAEIRKRVNQLLEFVQIGWLADRYPDQLSGGQRQRVALARALAIEPNVLLLDEPFGALDAKVRKSLRRWLRTLHDELHVTSILVTHDQEEALEVADRVVVMGSGNIEQVGTPEQIYDEPANSFVFDFMGESIRLPVTVESGAVWLGSQRLPANGCLPKSGPAELFVRPHDLCFGEPAGAPLQGAVRSVRRAGPASYADVTLELCPGTITVEAAVPPGCSLRVGERVGVTPRRYRIFDRPGKSLTATQA
ncbi:MAG: sulfate ABC transporter ATP-binding protein [Rhodomicrobium sp.]|nr:sulfate ABC transporter ATP-binding protein [Rhodomicrobium sp.]